MLLIDSWQDFAIEVGVKYEFKLISIAEVKSTSSYFVLPECKELVTIVN